MADEKAVIQISLDLNDVKKGLNDVKKDVKDTTDQGSREFTKMSGSAKAAFVAVGVAVAAAVATAVVTIKKSIDAASGYDDALNRLNTSLKLSGQFSEQTSKDFEALATEIQKTTKFSDAAVLASASLIQSLGRLSKDGLDRATRAAVDLSAALNIDLQTASALIGKAATGNIQVLGRYGIRMQSTGDAAKDFSSVLDRISTQFGGAAAAQANTYSGAMVGLGNAFSDVLKEIGFFVTRSPAMIAVINEIKAMFFEAAAAINLFGQTSDDPLKNIIFLLLDIGRAINDYVIKPIMFMNEVHTMVLNLMVAGVQKVITAFTWLGAKIAEILNMMGIVSDETVLSMQKVNDAQMLLGEGLAVGLNAQFEKLQNGLDINNNADAFIDRLQTAVEQAQPLTDSLQNQFNNVGETVAKAAEKTINFGAMMTRGVSTMVQGMTMSLKNGQNAFKSFTGAILGFIGDMAIQVGETLIGIGLGMEAVKASIVGLTGGPALFAGIALVALGTLLKSLSGGQGQAGGASTGSAGNAGAGGRGFASESPQEPELDEERERRSDTSVVLNIQGDVLDSDDSGLRIVDLISNAFDKQGVRVSNRFA